MSDPIEFEGLRMGRPFDNLCAAISIVQSEILAGDTCLNPDRLFGVYHFKRDGLETVVALLVGMIDEIEELNWKPEGEK